MSLDPKNYPYCFEFDVLEKTVMVAVSLASGEEVQIRIEAYKTNNPKSPYVTRCQVVGDADGRHKHWNFPWTSRDNADDAIAQALSFIGDSVRVSAAT
jgi:hypothetical protein